MLQSMGLQRVRHDRVTELNCINSFLDSFPIWSYTEYHVEFPELYSRSFLLIWNFKFKEYYLGCCFLSSPESHKQSKVLVAQLCLTLCNPKDCSPLGSSVYGDSPGKNTEVGCHALLQGIFPTQGLNPCFLWLLQCRWMLHH